MDQTVDQIAAHIDHTRERLGANLEELEQKVDAATDWRGQLRERPYLVLAAGCLGGMLLGAALRPRARRIAGGPEVRPQLVAARKFDARDQALDFWDNVVAALVGVAASRAKHYIDELIPGFDDEYSRATQRGTARSASAVFAKAGLADVPSHLGNAARTAIVLALSLVVMWWTGEHRRAAGVDGKAWLLLALSGVATTISWVAYFKALSIGSATPVTAIDKASLAITLVLAIAFLGERPTWTGALGVLFIVGGSVLVVPASSSLMTCQPGEVGESPPRASPAALPIGGGGGGGGADLRLEHARILPMTANRRQLHGRPILDRRVPAVPHLGLEQIDRRLVSPGPSWSCRRDRTPLL